MRCSTVVSHCPVGLAFLLLMWIISHQKLNVFIAELMQSYMNLASKRIVPLEKVASSKVVGPLVAVRKPVPTPTPPSAARTTSPTPTSVSSANLHVSTDTRSASNIPESVEPRNDIEPSHAASVHFHLLCGLMGKVLAFHCTHLDLTHPPYTPSFCLLLLALVALHTHSSSSSSKEMDVISIYFSSQQQKTNSAQLLCLLIPRRLATCATFCPIIAIETHTQHGE
ncbi:hypothetical protein Fcan01_13553 [Folsomia candida]|uniref:Uncharacterized protein n=1 Tax=Folsomia candida TaxID=158441 RepID=A0A226E4C8_FOLCA|nr:hypothetical protein Fcan01_13553 [Folsomia candida]